MKKIILSIMLSCSLLLDTTVSYAQSMDSVYGSSVDSVFDETMKELETTDLKTAGSEEPETVPGEVLVIYEGEEKITQLFSDIVEEEFSDISIASTEIIAEDIGEGEKDIALFEVGNDSQTQELIDRLNEQEGVLAQPNYIYHTFKTPEPCPVEADAVNVFAETNDFYATEQYYLNDYSLSGTSGAGVYKAWDVAKVEKSVTVAILDTGCDTNHPDIIDNIDTEHMWDVYNDSPDMLDGDGHGTHVCGIVGAVADNEIGIAGVSYNANVLPIKIFDDTGENSNTSYIIKAYDYLRQLIETGELNNLHVVNMSLGLYRSQLGNDTALEQVISDLREDYQVLTVAAGGNGENGLPLTTYCIPSDFDCVLSVTCLDKNGGNSFWSDYNECKDISAPGEYIYSTYLNSGYKLLSGTSMAAPLVSGIASLLFAAVPGVTPDDVEDAIKSTAHSMEGKENDRGSETGSAGAIDAAAALEKLVGDFEESELEETETEITNLVDVPTVTRGLVYNGSLQEGVLQGDGYTLSGQASAVNAGDYTVYATPKPGYQWRGEPDGANETKSFTWSIAKKSALIAPNDASKTYGEKDPELTASVAGVVDGERLDYSVEREKGEDVGLYFISIVEGDNPNYKLVTTHAVFTINEAQEETEIILPKIGSTYSVGKLCYRVTSFSEKTKEVSVVKPVKSTNKKITIPATVKIDGYSCKVTQIDPKAFYKNKKLTQVVIGSNVTTIGKQAFFGSSRLKKIDVKSGKLNKIGTKAFAKISGKAKIYVPKKKYGSYLKKLKKAKTMKDAKVIKR